MSDPSATAPERAKAAVSGSGLPKRKKQGVGPQNHLPADLRQSMQQEPWRFDVLSLLRRLEAAYPDLPRLGQSVTLTQEIAVPRQDPFLEFPSANVTRMQFNSQPPHDVHVQFMGYFGPQLGQMRGLWCRWTARRMTVFASGWGRWSDWAPLRCVTETACRMISVWV